MTCSLKPGKFVCPPSFTPIDGPSVLYSEEIDDDTELWIIQAPVGVDMTKFYPHPINHEGTTTVTIENESVSNYQCMATEYSDINESGYHLVLPKKSDNKLCYVSKPFKGHLLITEQPNTPNFNIPLLNRTDSVHSDSETSDTTQIQEVQNTESLKKKRNDNIALDKQLTNNDILILNESPNQKHRKAKHSHDTENDRSKDVFSETEKDKSKHKSKPSTVELVDVENSKSLEGNNLFLHPKRKKHKRKSLSIDPCETENEMTSTTGVGNSDEPKLTSDNFSHKKKKKHKRKAPSVDLSETENEMAPTTSKSNEPKLTSDEHDFSRQKKKKHKKHGRKTPPLELINKRTTEIETDIEALSSQTEEIVTELRSTSDENEHLHPKKKKKKKSKQNRKVEEIPPNDLELKMEVDEVLETFSEEHQGNKKAKKKKKKHDK